jgi:hypothetical protein
MDDAARAQEMWTQLTSRNLEMLSVWADANQRLLKEWVEFAYRLQGTAEQAGKGLQATFTEALAKTKEIYARAA